jgi:hypothetical protein
LTGRGVVEHKGHHHVDLILGDLAVVHTHVLLLDPGSADVADGLAGAREAEVNGVLEALGGRGTDFGDFGY